MTLTYSLAEAAPMVPCSERWLADGLRSGKFRGRKIMGEWRLTDSDLRDILDACRVEPGDVSRPGATPRARAAFARGRR